VQPAEDRPDHFENFEINLDLAPEDRFVEVAAHFREEIINATNVLIGNLPPYTDKFFEWVYPIWSYIHPSKYGEIEGIVKGVNSTELPMSRGVLLNAIYELGAWCTSVVVKQADGTIIHGRNLDYPDEVTMQAIVYNGTFTRNGEEVFNAVMFAGNIGVYTGVRNNSFSVSQDTRHFLKHYSSLLANIIMLFTGFAEQSWLMREALETCAHYDCAHKMLRDVPINGFGYLIVAGTEGDQGVVLSRDRFGAAHEDFLDSANDKWFLVQTNSDHWKDGCTKRCAATTQGIEDVGRDNINVHTLRGVMETNPQLNHMTLFNSQFIPSQNYHDTVPEYYNRTMETPDDMPQPLDLLKDLTWEQIMTDAVIELVFNYDAQMAYVQDIFAMMKKLDGGRII